MLILSRREGETIVIDGTIRVTVIEVRGDQVRIGIEAPRSVSVHRQEVFEQISELNRRASEVSPADLGRLAPPPGKTAPQSQRQRNKP
jgi:carbon storage regulator